MNTFDNNDNTPRGPLTIDDPRLTALALGELNDAALLAEAEKSPELSREMERIRAAAKALEGAFAEEAAEPAPVKKPVAIPVAPKNRIVRFPLLKPSVYMPLTGIAAMAVIAIGIFNYRGDSGKPLPTLTTEAPEKPGATTAAPQASETISAPEASNAGAPQVSPFKVTASDNTGHASTQTLSETRFRTDLKDLAKAIDEVNRQFLADTGASASQELLVYTANTEIGGVCGNFVSDHYQPEPVDREGYDAIVANAFTSPLAEPLSTFSIDVDTASYANVRRMINDGYLPPAGAVRIEEMLNYFSYNYAPPADKGAPFAAHIVAASAPWAPEHQIVRIALKGYEVPWENRPASNLVFLVDVSGSMDEPDKLPLVKEGLKMLVERLDARDSVAIVTYAGYEELALPSTTANNRETILHAIDRLGAGGSTNGAGGISLAYEQAKAHYLEKGLNRVILCTDGDFNVGTTSRSDLVDLVAGEAKSGVFLSIFSFGTGNLQDSTMEQLADKGNGNYGYVDSESEARRVFVRNISGNLITIAKDVKIQVEFNPACVQAYRLIGYENRKLEAQDFNDDKKDAGEIGAGHCVTALYEVIPVGAKWEEPASVDALKYQKNPPEKEAAAPSPGEMLTVKVRFKDPDGDVSRKLEFPFAAKSVTGWDKADTDTRFAAAVALFGMELRKSPNAGSGSLAMAKDLAAQALGAHPGDERIEFLELVRRAEEIRKAQEAREKAGKDADR
jgi:secreted protein with Ig-like and vWFA domain